MQVLNAFVKHSVFTSLPNVKRLKSVRVGYFGTFKDLSSGGVFSGWVGATQLFVCRFCLELFFPTSVGERLLQVGLLI